MARGICIRAINKNDQDQVRQLCYEYWRTDELAKAIKLQVPQDCEHFVDYMVEEGLHNKVSFAFEDTLSGKLVGIIISAILTTSSDNDYKNRIAERKQEKMMAYHEMIDKWVMPKNCFALYNVDKILFSLCCIISPEYQKRGLSTKALTKTLNAARELGVPLVLFDSTSEDSCKILNKFGFKKIQEAMLPQNKDHDFMKKGHAVKTVRVACHMMWLQTEQLLD